MPIKESNATPEDQVNPKSHIQEKHLNFRITGVGIVTAGLSTEPALERAYGQWYKRYLAH